MADDATERDCVSRTNRSAGDGRWGAKLRKPSGFEGCCFQPKYFNPTDGTDGQRELETDSDVPPLVDALRLVLWTQPRSIQPRHAFTKAVKIARCSAWRSARRSG